MQKSNSPTWPLTYCRCKEYLAKTMCCAILSQIAETHPPELSDHQNTQNLMADSIFGVPAARNPKKSSKINFARFLSSPSTPGPNLAPMDLCGIFGFSSPSTVGPCNMTGSVSADRTSRHVSWSFCTTSVSP